MDWWKKSGTPVEVGSVSSIIYKVWYIPGGCLGFLPSTGWHDAINSKFYELHFHKRCCLSKSGLNLLNNSLQKRGGTSLTTEFPAKTKKTRAIEMDASKPGFPASWTPFKMGKLLGGFSSRHNPNLGVEVGWCWWSINSLLIDSKETKKGTYLNPPKGDKWFHRFGFNWHRLEGAGRGQYGISTFKSPFVKSASFLNYHGKKCWLINGDQNYYICLLVFLVERTHLKNSIISPGRVENDT